MFSTSKRRISIARLFLRKGLKEALHVVRGPAFLSVLSLSLLLVIPTAQATLLKGYVTNVAQSAGAPAPGAANAQPDSATASPQAEIAAKSAATQSQAEVVESPAEASMRRRASTLASAVADNSFPTSFAGSWRAVSVVTGSGVSTVAVGEKVESEVSFVRSHDGRIIAEWQQPGWTDGQEKITPFSDKEASLDRTNYFVDQTASGEWAARSHDHYLQLDPNRMVATSDVEQFIAGQYMGRYKTRSMLYRVD